MGTLREDLAVAGTELRETHISWVFLTADEAYKVKKPVDYGFLDFSTLERRRAACDAEVALNARLSADVYRGVVPVTRDADGVHRFGGDGEIVDFAVRMRRLSDTARADALLARGELGVPEIDRMAGHIARFHAECRADEETAAFGAPATVERNVRENFEQTAGALEGLVTSEVQGEIERAQLGFLEEEASTLIDRAESGRVRDGHGDLRLEHFYFEGGARDSVRVIDCIEFNERFRYADVCADIAFLSMDLAWHGRVDLAERVIATYARDANDFDLYGLVDFYESYRAYVRGKIATFLANDEHAPTALREHARAEARRYFLLALAAERRPVLPPVVVALGGLLATGKSTIADRLGAILGAPAINTDRVRKHMLGARATDRVYEASWKGAYDPEFTVSVYAEVYRSARAVLDSGRPVIIDGSFRSRARRAEARRAAERAEVPFVFVECTAPHDVLRERLRQREQGETVSDGRLEIFDDFVASWEHVDELPAAEHVLIDTTLSIEENLETLRARLPMWPEGLTAE